MLSAFSLQASSSEKPQANPSAPPTTCIYYFYGFSCHYCAKTTPYINQLQNTTPSLNVHKFEVYNNKTNAEMMESLFKYHNISARGVPVVFVADTYLLGLDQITGSLESEIKAHPNAKCPSSENQTASHKTPFNMAALLAIAGAALIDSINPCAIAVLLILMTSLFVLGKPKLALKSGMAFIIAVYIMYFLFGLGLLAIFKEVIFSLGGGLFANISAIIKIIVGVFALLIGLANIKDFFWYGGAGFIIEIPIKWRPGIKKLLSRVASPLGAFVVGLFVSAFELPCTGGPYFFVLGYLADKVTYTAIIPILLFYNIIFVAPLILLSLLLYFGLTSVERIEHLRQKNLKIVHLITGIIMLALGMLVIFGII